MRVSMASHAWRASEAGSLVSPRLRMSVGCISFSKVSRCHGELVAVGSCSNGPRPNPAMECWRSRVSTVRRDQGKQSGTADLEICAASSEAGRRSECREKTVLRWIPSADENADSRRLHCIPLPWVCDCRSAKQRGNCSVLRRSSHELQ